MVERTPKTKKEKRHTRLQVELTALFALLSINMPKVVESVAEITKQVHLPMNIILGLLLAAISGVFEEKALLFIENTSSDEGLIRFFISCLPALLAFTGAGGFYIAQSYFLKEAGATYAVVSFLIWSAVVVGLLLKESTKPMGPTEIALVLISAISLTYLQVRLSN